MLYLVKTLRRLVLMAGELKNRQHYGVTVDIGLLRKLRELSEKTQIPQSKLIDRAIELLLQEHKGR